MPNSCLHTQLTHARTFWDMLKIPWWRHYSNNNSKKRIRVASPWIACSRITSSRWISSTAKKPHAQSKTERGCETSLGKSGREREAKSIVQTNALSGRYGHREQRKCDAMNQSRDECLSESLFWPFTFFHLSNLIIFSCSLPKSNERKSMKMRKFSNNIYYRGSHKLYQKACELAHTQSWFRKIYYHEYVTKTFSWWQLFF